MINIITFRKHYVKPTILKFANSSCNLLEVSCDKELPFDPDDGTEEALAPDFRNDGEADNDLWNNSIW